MAIPTFVSAGNTAGQTGGVSVTGILPAGVVAGNLLIAVVNLSAPAEPRTFGISPSSWTRVVQVCDSIANVAVFWKIAGAGETAPTFSWSGNNTTANTRIYQFSGVYAANPLGWKSPYFNLGNSTTPNQDGITTINNNSLVVALLQAGLSAPYASYTPPAGWTELAAPLGVTGGSESLYSMGVAAAGTPTGAVSAVTPATRWTVVTLEILGEAPPPAEMVEAQSFLEVLTSDTETMPTISGTFLSQSYLEVLRSEADSPFGPKPKRKVIVAAQ